MSIDIKYMIQEDIITLKVLCSSELLVLNVLEGRRVEVLDSEYLWRTVRVNVMN